MADKFNYARSRSTADRLIAKFGAKALLRRASGDRECIAVETSQSGNENHQLKNFNARTFLISVSSVSPPPSKEDALIVFKQDGTEHTPLRQTAPVVPLAPAGYIVFYELRVE